MSRFLSRRLLLGSTAAATASVDAPALPAESTVSANPDATLIAACAEFDRLERQCFGLFYGPARITDEDQRDDAMTLISEAQKPSWNVICSTQAKTLEGLRAKAQTVAMEDLELFPALRQDMDSAFTNFSLQASLMLDVFAVLGVKETLVPRRGDVVAQEGRE
jgi:hypothetical protein